MYTIIISHIQTLRVAKLISEIDVLEIYFQIQIKVYMITIKKSKI